MSLTADHVVREYSLGPRSNQHSAKETIELKTNQCNPVVRHRSAHTRCTVPIFHTETVGSDHTVEVDLRRFLMLHLHHYRSHSLENQ